MPDQVHSHIGGSSLYRWSVCPGSPAMIAKSPKRPSSPYADEGTAAHALGAQCLEANVPAANYRNCSIDISTQPAHFYFDDPSKVQSVKGKLIPVDQEMVDGVDLYLQTVRDYHNEPERTDHMNPTETLAGTSLFIEVKIDLSIVHPGAFGYVDAGILDTRDGRLTVVDFKYGRGIVVSAVHNKQLMYYALGLLRLLSANGRVVKSIRLVIVQPRAEHPEGYVRHWDIDALDLLDFEQELRAWAKATDDPNAALVPGSHCQFCVPNACPAVAKQQDEVLKVRFEPLMPYDPEKLADMLDAIPALKAKIAAVTEFAYAEAVAGRVIPRHKLVAKKARRKWNDPVVVEEILQDLGATDDQMYEPKELKSVAQMEEVFGPKVLKNYWISESSGSTLVPEGNSRKALPPPVVETFKPIAAPTDTEKS